MNLKFRFVTISYPFDESGESKNRPALCLVNPVGKFSQVIVAYVSSQIPAILEASDLLIDPTDFAGTGLKLPSVLRLHRLFSVDALTMQRTLGTLPITLEAEAEVEDRLRRLFGL